MNYLDVYFSRVNHFGETKAERIKNSGIVAFEKWLAQSPFTVVDLSVERGYYFSGIIQTNKDKEEKKIMFLYVALDIPIRVGDILTWRQDNGVTEKWHLLQKEHKVHEQYQTFQIIKCNYDLKWIDTDGYLRKSWAYAVSSVDSKVKGNFRMWHSLISPQPNKFAEIIMPRPELVGTDVDQLMRGITFIIENEGWIVIECDWTSVEGIVYMSLTESKVNYQYDDRNIDVADTDRYKFPNLASQFKVDEVVVPQFEAGTLNQWEIELRPSNFDLFTEEKEMENEDEKWYSELHPISTADGMCIITMRLKNRPAVSKNVEITIIPSEQQFIAYIDGSDQLRLDRQDKYRLNANLPLANNNKIVFTIQSWPDMEKKQSKEYVTLRQDMDDNNNPIPNQYRLHANARNNLGKIILAATYTVMNDQDEIISEQTYTKTVEIIPLW